MIRDSELERRFMLKVIPVPYTRQTGRSRFGPGFWESQAGRYERYKQKIRDLLVDSEDVRTCVMAYFEPLCLSVKFYVSTNYSSVDLSNLVKGIEDALNPVVRKTGGRRSVTVLLWEDDKQIRRYSGCDVVPCQTGVEGISLRVQPLWGRDGMFSFIKGVVVWSNGKEVEVLTRSGFGFTLLLSSAEVSNIWKEGAEVSFWVHPHVYGQGSLTFQYYGFTSKEELRVFKDIATIQGLGVKKASAALSLGVVRIIEAVARKDTLALSSVKGIGPSVAEKIISKLFDKDYIQVVDNLSQVDESKFEDVASGIQNLFDTPVTRIRAWLRDQEIDWSCSVEDILSYCLRQYKGG